MSRLFMIALVLSMYSCQILEQEAPANVEKEDEALADTPVTSIPLAENQAEKPLPKPKTKVDIGKLKNATVFIKTNYGTGSGFFLETEDGNLFVVTNAHVLRKPSFSPEKQPIYGYVNSGTPLETEIRLHLVYETLENDLALLEVSTENDWEAFTLPEFDPEVFETKPILVAGYPFGEMLSSGQNPAPTVTNGTISSIRRNDYNFIDAVQLDANLNPGNSGGPVGFPEKTFRVGHQARDPNHTALWFCNSREGSGVS